jgi:hypothetical protein
MNENECANGHPNDCHRYAICTDTEGSYTCACKDGYEDLSAKGKPGTKCAQINECLSPSINDCDTEREICIDLPPPEKWECVSPTAAPTCSDSDITMVIRVSFVDDPSDYVDSPSFNCVAAERRDGYCACQGKYPAHGLPNYNTELVVIGATGPGGCCYCETRNEERCVLLDV